MFLVGKEEGGKRDDPYTPRGKEDIWNQDGQRPLRRWCLKQPLEAGAQCLGVPAPFILHFSCSDGVHVCTGTDSIFKCNLMPKATNIKPQIDILLP